MTNISTKSIWKRRKEPKVQVVRGELFEGGADLVVLPRSVKGTINTATKISVEHFNLEKPQSFSIALKLGLQQKEKFFRGLPILLLDNTVMLVRCLMTLRH
jgi:hypothetical protein